MKRTLASKVENLIEVTHHPDSPIDLIDLWKSQGYTHIHFGAIRLVLTLHGRKGLPVTAKVALLDSTYKKYSDAIIGALLTTLSNGSVTTRLADDTSIIQIPRQIPKEELAQIMPMEWISNYEKLFHGIQMDVHTTTAPNIHNLGDGVTKTVFSRPSVSGFGMCDPNCECNTSEWWEDSDDEQGLYPCKYASQQAQRNKSSPRSPCRSHRSKKFDDDDDYGSSQPVPSRRSTRHYDLVRKYFPDVVPNSPPEPHNHPLAALQPVSCIAMLNPYEQDFPPLERRVDHNTRVPSRPYVVPNTVDAPRNYQSTQALCLGSIMRFLV
ncbi:hypothetical protein K1719_020970 [Acacia pycnantha]|nr:hypothetical protein K1719_020970 [Acacia pycnantha]